MTIPIPLPDLDPDPDLTPVVAMIGRELSSLDLRALSPRDSLELLGLLLRIRGREADR